ncbi:hypothetical protein PoB_003562700 [Plakobranchus ocellatus]|uniref:Uncharacterized protein n=1 Tax=Plakobranchus ocellatus TaxID=259542 RepID=A0AAV4AQA7_9GAST|nr:hypothetical protein PoB_003562700 [Plakobranchus ocellatus]
MREDLKHYKESLADIVRLFPPFLTAGVTHHRRIHLPHRWYSTGLVYCYNNNHSSSSSSSSSSDSSSSGISNNNRVCHWWPNGTVTVAFMF